MILVTDAAPGVGDPVDIADAKRHLRIFTGDLDTDISGKLTAATEWCESYVSRTLRSAVTRTLKRRNWCRGETVQLPFPPILSVESVKYSDADDVEQTLDPANYHVVVTTESVGWIEWAWDADLPEVFNRPDAIRIQYRAGYGSVVSVPQKAKQAILLYLDVLWGDAKAKDLEHAERSAKSLLTASDWGSYS